LPPRRNFLVACGLESVLAALEGLTFDAEDIDYLASLGLSHTLLEDLANFRFEGDLYAVPEGTPIFANEPIVEIVAPIAQAQLVETLVLNRIGFETVVASKAARIVRAADGRPVLEWGARHAASVDAAVRGARAAYIGGIDATSNVLAAKTFGIPLGGALSHSFVQALPTESQALREFALRHPEMALIVDTYDAIKGVRNVITIAREFRHGPPRIGSVRIDSGNLLEVSRRARNLLDGAGLTAIQIMASGDLDDQSIEDLVTQGAPIDSFAVGTDLLVSADSPTLDIVYKLTEFAGEDRMKLSANKRTIPGRKQIYRTFAEGRAYSDTLGPYEDSTESGLIQRVMEHGRRVAEPQSLTEIRARCAAELARLPPELLTLAPAEVPYPVEISPALLEREQRLREKLSHSAL
jgi:nicotinate phosphoribosyltransferase